MGKFNSDYWLHYFYMRHNLNDETVRKYIKRSKKLAKTTQMRRSAIMATISFLLDAGYSPDKVEKDLEGIIDLSMKWNITVPKVLLLQKRLQYYANVSGMSFAEAASRFNDCHVLIEKRR